jgi:hypothetical protein
MPGPCDIALGNEKLNMITYTASVTTPNLGANASATTTLTLTGVQPLDCIGWNMQAPPAHLVIDNIYVSSLNTLTILWGTDGTGISPTTVAVIFTVERAGGAIFGTVGLPTIVQ